MEDIRATGTKTETLPTTDKIIDYVVDQTEEGDILCILSNGGFGNIHQKLLNALGH